RRLVSACWRHPWLVVLAFGAAVLGVGALAAGPLLVKQAIDEALAGDTARLGVLALGLIGLAVLTFGAAFVRRYFGGRLALDVQHDLRQQVFGAVSRLDGGTQDSLRTGQIASRAITDLQLMVSLLMQGPLSVGSAVYLLLALGAMLWMSPLLTLIALVVTPAIGLAVAAARMRVFPAIWSSQQRAADLAQHVEETVTGVRVVKGFGQESREVSRLERAARKLFGENLRVARRAVGGLVALDGDVSLGTLVAFASYAAGLVSPARMVTSLLRQAQIARAGAERVYELIDAQPEVTGPDEPRELPSGPLSVRL